jgi:hypothetical protein
MTPLRVARALAAGGERERLVRLSELVASDPQQAVVLGSQGLAALLEERPDEAVELLSASEAALRSLGRRYDAACIALDVGRALEAAGDSDGARVAKARAADVLDRLGCTHPW